MRALIVFVSLLWVGIAVPAAAETVIVFVDGNQMEIRSYEVKGNLVLITTLEGKLQSVPRSYVNLVATEQRNRGGKAAPPASTSPPPTAPAPRPPRSAPAPKPSPEPEAMPTETITPEPEVPAPVPPPRTPEPSSTAPNLRTSPPPEWSNDELKVSLVVPSSAWVLQDMPPSFDVAVAIHNPSTDARATLALIRQQLRSRKDFRKVLDDIEKSISQAPGYRSLVNGPLELDPYTAHEFRFTKDVGFISVFNRLVVFYSRDLAYVLSLSCPEDRVEENRADFEALVRGLVIRKSRNDLSY
jgi:hypothetical protein